MSKHFPLTTAALRKFGWLLRVLACETLMKWGIAIRPDDYIPALIDEAFKRARAGLTTKP